jgi:YidC/Oxa1 family membrane protein insertase
MDLFKTFLIATIGIILYYLLLQWPSGSVIDDTSRITGNKDISISNSDDLLTPLEFSTADGGFSNPTEPQADSNFSSDFVLENDVLALGVNGKSGRIVSSKLKKIKTEKGQEEEFEIFGKTPSNFYFANSGFYSDSGYLDPNFRTQTSYVNDEGDIVFTLRGSNKGAVIERTVLLKRGKYYATITDSFLMGEGLAAGITPYVVIQRSDEEVEEGGLAYTYLGPVFSTQKERFEKYSFGDIEDDKFTEDSVGGWASMIQHYFATAWVSDQSKTHRYQARKSSYTDRFSIGYTGASSAMSNEYPLLTTTNTLYVGPKLPAQLKEVHVDLDLVVDYGFLWWLGKPMYWLLNAGHDFLQNWGLAIIFLTVVLKIFTWPLSATAYKGMAKMRKFAPQLQALQSQNTGDKQKQSQEMMAFYKKEGINPLSGCLPMLAQMPFFLAFYWVLMETVELRHSPFIFWIDDLSEMDPYFILPLLNAAGMYFSQKLTPTPANADPMQAKMMKYFPLLFAGIFAFFPSGLVLYWLTNMLVTLFQQWWYSRGVSE